MTKTADISIADIEAQVATDTAVPFEPLTARGEPCGITFDVLSDQAPSVFEKVAKLEDGRRQKEQLIAAQARGSRPGHAPIITSEDAANHYRRLVACRVSGWSLKDAFNEANLIRVFKVQPTWADQILAKAIELGNFTPTSSPTS